MAAAAAAYSRLASVWQQTGERQQRRSLKTAVAGIVKAGGGGIAQWLRKR